MKARDVALLIIIAVISLISSIILSNLFISTPENRAQQVEIVQPISASFTPPDETYFNKEAVNPTQLIKIGEDQNQKPFGSD